MEYLIGYELDRSRTTLFFCDLLVFLVNIKFRYRQPVRIYVTRRDQIAIRVKKCPVVDAPFVIIRQRIQNA